MYGMVNHDECRPKRLPLALNSSAAHAPGRARRGECCALRLHSEAQGHAA